MSAGWLSNIYPKFSIYFFNIEKNKIYFEVQHNIACCMDIMQQCRSAENSFGLSDGKKKIKKSKQTTMTKIPNSTSK